MAKTVFGMPGVGKAPEGSGDAVAPEGTPGATSTTGLPQKSGKEPAKRDTRPMKKPEFPSDKPPSAAQQQDPEKPKMAVPVAKPAAQPGAPANPDAGKTVFGMPAMKLPVPPEKTTAAKETPNVVATPSTPPAPASDADPAYNATVLGIPAVDPSAVPTESADAPVAAVAKTIETAQVLSPSAHAPSGETAPDAEPVQAMDSGFDHDYPRKKTPTWILIVAVAGMLLIATIIALLRTT
ncbi:MAG: hypothetical protein QNJ97_00170 [Myxococcota bacterium]|nr:hypothetical protein [Myxococcota bacterium]